MKIELTIQELKQFIKITPVDIKNNSNIKIGTILNRDKEEVEVIKENLKKSLPNIPKEKIDRYFSKPKFNI